MLKGCNYNFSNVEGKTRAFGLALVQEAKNVAKNFKAGSVHLFI